MATNKMRLRHAYRTGGDDFVEEKYGVKIKSQYTPDLDNNMIVINTGV